jgi:hypothetical protein
MKGAVNYGYWKGAPPGNTPTGPVNTPNLRQGAFLEKRESLF